MRLGAIRFRLATAEPGITALAPGLPLDVVHPHALRSARRCDALEKVDDRGGEDVIPITGDHMGGVGHVHILSVRALGEETLGPGLA